jgi:MFS family permease
MKTLTGFREIFSNRNVGLMAITVPAFHFAVNLFSPWLPLYAQALGAPIPVVGAIFSIKGIVGFTMSGIGGVLSDRYGRRKMILLGHVFRLLSPIVYLFATTWQHLLLGIIVNSLSMIYEPSIYTIIIESLAPKQRTTGFGFIQTILLLVNSVTMLIGGVTFDVLGMISGMKIILIIVLIIEVGRFLLRFFSLQETLTKKPEVPPGFRDSILPGKLQLKRSVWGMLFTLVLFQMGFFMSYPFIVVFATETIGLTKTQWGMVQLAFFVVYALFSLPGGMFAAKYGNRLAIFLTGIIAPLPLFSYMFLTDFWALLAVNILYGVGAGFGGVLMGGGPAWQAMIGELVPIEKRGRAIGLMKFISGTISAITPTIGGFLYDGISPIATLASAGMLTTVSALVFWVFAKEKRESNEHANLSLTVEQ